MLAVLCMWRKYGMATELRRVCKCLWMCAGCDVYMKEVLTSLLKLICGVCVCVRVWVGGWVCVNVSMFECTCVYMLTALQTRRKYDVANEVWCVVCLCLLHVHLSSQHTYAICSTICIWNVSSVHKAWVCTVLTWHVYVCIRTLYEAMYMASLHTHTRLYIYIYVYVYIYIYINAHTICSYTWSYHHQLYMILPYTTTGDGVCMRVPTCL